MIDIFTLKNGVRVVTYQIAPLKSVHLSLAVKGGGFGEKEDKNGVAHFMEHMLVQGTKSFTNGEDLSFYIENLAGNYNAFTDDYTVNFVITLPYTNIEDAIRVSSEVFFQPTFPENAIEKERNAILTEIAQRNDSQGYKLNQVFKSTRFSSKILQRDTGGELEDVQKITKEDMESYWGKYFVPNNTYIFIGGNFRSDRVKKLLVKYFENIPQEKKHVTPLPLVMLDDFKEKGVFLRPNDSYTTNYADISFSTIGFLSDWKEQIKQDLALSLLGQFRTSRLFTLLRYQKGLLYSIYAQKWLYPEVGLIHITYEAPEESLEEATSLTFSTLRDFITKGPTADELDFAKRYFTNSWLMTFDNPSSVANWFEAGLLWFDKVRTPEDYIEMVKDITGKDIWKFMQKHWDLTKVQLLIQGTLKDIEANQQNYKRFIEK